MSLPRPAKRAAPRPLKITIVGDGATGKTCLLYSYKDNIFPTDYIPTVFDSHVTHHSTVQVDGEKYATKLVLWDTAGQVEYERLRPLSYPNTDCFIVCYSVVHPDSLKNIRYKWIPELKKICPKSPVILVGNKLDLKGNGQKVVTTNEGLSMKAKIRAHQFLECSALTRQNLEEVFNAAVKAATLPNRNRSCVVC